MTIADHSLHQGDVLYRVEGRGAARTITRVEVTKLELVQKGSRYFVQQIDLTDAEGTRTIPAALWYKEAPALRRHPPEWQARADGKAAKKLKLPFTCPTCGALTADKRDRSRHKKACTHPAAKRWRRKDAQLRLPL